MFGTVTALPAVSPMPPQAGWRLPWVGAGAALLRDPSEFFRRQRCRLGDTYVVDAFGYRLFCVFSAAGVRQLYALPENEASFGLATFELVLKRKLPLEMLAGRRNYPHTLFGKQDVEDYLSNLEAATRHQIDELGASGSFEVFALMRRLGHRLGLHSWAGPEAASPRYLDRLIPLFERLDSGDSFVRPMQGFVTAATRKRREYAAMHGIEAVFGEILATRQQSSVRHGDFLDRIWESFADLQPGEREQNVARDIMVIHMGAQSNLYAALAWTLVNLLQHPLLLERVRGGDDVLLEQCANESIRMAQRSITLRQVLTPLELDDGQARYRLEPGVMITTMLPVTNTTAAPGLERFDPQHYVGRKLAEDIAVPAKELVSTFGHGRHSCPAQRFSISAIRIAVRRLVEVFDIKAPAGTVAPRRQQIGGVARAAAPCRVVYRRRVPAPKHG